MPLHSLPTCLWKRGFETSNRASRATAQPLRRKEYSFPSKTVRAIDIGRPEQFERAAWCRGPPRAVAPLDHNRGPRRRAAIHKFGALGAGELTPRSLAQRPAVPGLRHRGCHPLHLDNAIFDIELERFDKPRPQLSECQPVAHWQRPRRLQKLCQPARQRQAFDRPANGIGPVQDPHRFAKSRDAASRRIAERRG